MNESLINNRLQRAIMNREEINIVRLKQKFYGHDSSHNQTLILSPSAHAIYEEARLSLLRSKLTIPDENSLHDAIVQLEESLQIELSPKERESVIRSLNEAQLDFHILQPLVDQHDINDIIVTSYNDISIQTERRNIQTNLSFPDRNTYLVFIEQLLKRIGKSCTLATPVVDGSISSHIRICVTHESFSPPGQGPYLTIRVSRNRAVTLDSLVAFQMIPPLIKNYLDVLSRSGLVTFLVSGEVGTGKTTCVRALAASIPEDEAILTIEDTSEIALQRPFVRTLLTREANSEGAGKILPDQAIRTGMRMAMNRIILGEMRDGLAAEAFIDVCSSGHVGMSTIHSRSGRDALARLELFLSRAQGQVQIQTIRKQISQAVNVVLHLGIDPIDGKRRILEVLEIVGSSEGTIATSPIFLTAEGVNHLSPQNRIPTSEFSWIRGAGISQYKKILSDAGVNLPPSGTQISLHSEDNPKTDRLERISA